MTKVEQLSRGVAATFRRVLGFQGGELGANDRNGHRQRSRPREGLAGVPTMMMSGGVVVGGRADARKRACWTYCGLMGLGLRELEVLALQQKA